MLRTATVKKNKISTSFCEIIRLLSFLKNLTDILAFERITKDRLGIYKNSPLPWSWTLTLIELY